MAKRKSRKVNKSAAIKEYLAKHPTAVPKEISTELKKKGIHVTPAYVSDIKSKMKTGATSKPGRRRKKSTQDTSPAEDVMHAGELMFQAVDLVMKAGYKEAKTMVEVAGKMVDRIREKK